MDEYGSKIKVINYIVFDDIKGQFTEDKRSKCQLKIKPCNAFFKAASIVFLFCPRIRLIFISDLPERRTNRQKKRPKLYITRKVVQIQSI